MCAILVTKVETTFPEWWKYSLAIPEEGFYPPTFNIQQNPYLDDGITDASFYETKAASPIERRVTLVDDGWLKTTLHTEVILYVFIVHFYSAFVRSALRYRTATRSELATYAIVPPAKRIPSLSDEYRQSTIRQGVFYNQLLRSYESMIIMDIIRKYYW